MQKVLTDLEDKENTEWITVPVIGNIPNSVGKLDKMLREYGFSQVSYGRLHNTRIDWYGRRYRKQLGRTNISVHITVDAAVSSSESYIRIAVHKDLATDSFHHLTLRAEPEMVKNILENYGQN